MTKTCILENKDKPQHKLYMQPILTEITRAKTTSLLALLIIIGQLNISAQQLNAPNKLYFFRSAQENTLYWNDTNTSETEYVIESKTDDTEWIAIDSVSANTSSVVLSNTDPSISVIYRIKAKNSTNNSAYSESVRIVGTDSKLEVYPEIPGIRNPKDTTVKGITFSMLQDQCPAEPNKGKATRVSTFFSAQVKLTTDDNFKATPVYETRPQIRDDRTQSTPSLSAGHQPYGYPKYGPSLADPSRTLHSKHWTNFDAAENVIVRIFVLESASYSRAININGLDIQPAPLSIVKVDDYTIDVELPSAQDFTRLYRVAINKNLWASKGGRFENVTEAPLFIFVNPIQIAPASAPKGEIKEFDNGKLVVYGAGIHLPQNKYRFFGNGENSVIRQLYAPGDAYIHAGYIFNNKNYAVKVWGRAIYSDEMFRCYDWASNTRTPWSTINCTQGNTWNLEAPWDGRAEFYNGGFSQPSTLEGFTNIGARMGVSNSGSNAALLNHKDVGYGGGTYQRGNQSTSNTKYEGCLLINDDDITYVHHRYTMNNCASYNMQNGPTWQLGWQVQDENKYLPVITNHTIMESDRSKGSGFWHNQGVFNSRLKIGELKYHSVGYWENLTVWGQENIVWNIRIWDEDVATPNTTSIIEDKTFKNFTIKYHSRNDNILWGDQNAAKNQKSYLRFLHFDSLIIAGNHVTNIKDGDFFDYNEGLLLHTVTFFSMPKEVAQPQPGSAPIGKFIQIKTNDIYVQADTNLPASLDPLCANTDSTAETFYVEDAGNGMIALKAANGHYVKADKKRYGYMYTQPDLHRGDKNGSKIEDAAKFIWVNQANNKFALYSVNLGLYVRKELNCGPQMPLYAASDKIEANEMFEFKLGDEPDYILSIPGKIEAEDFTAFEGVQTQTTKDDGGGLNVGWIESGDWMDYNIHVKQSGNYEVEFRIASASQTINLLLLTGDTLLSEVTVPTSGGWQTWVSSKATVHLTQGNQTLRVLANSSFWNYNWMNFELIGTNDAVKSTVDANINIYPNPSAAQVYISGVSLGANVCVYNITGKKEKQFKIDNFTETFNVNDLNNGIYFIEITTQNQRYVKQFVVNKRQ